jgi:hypothetical protein
MLLHEELPLLRGKDHRMDIGGWLRELGLATVNVNGRTPHARNSTPQPADPRGGGRRADLCHILELEEP